MIGELESNRTTRDYNDNPAPRLSAPVPPPAPPDEDLLDEDALGYLNHVGRVFGVTPSPANSGSREVISTGAFP